jgi:ribose transport system substrate-binding protein
MAEAFGVAGHVLVTARVCGPQRECIFLQEAGGQGIEATQQVYNALTGKPTTKEMPLTEPLVTAKEIESSEAQAKLKRVYPPSAGQY